MNVELHPHLRPSELPISDAEVAICWNYWRLTYEKHEPTYLLREGSYLKGARKSLLHSYRSAALKLGCADTNWRKFESSEADGTISLKSLKAAAEALDCDLVYEIKPKNNREFSRVLFDAALADVRDHSYLKNCVVNRRPFALANLITARLGKVDFRRKQGLGRKRK